MRPRNHGLLALGLSVCLASLIAKVSTEQAPVQAQQTSSDGLVHSELALSGHAISVAFAPGLKADDPANGGVLSAGGSANARVRVAQLVTSNGTPRLGMLDLKKADRAGLRYDLWLEGTSSGWQLQVAAAQAPGKEASGSAAMVGTVPLSREASGVASPTFEAALIPTASDSAQLVLRWGGYQGTADIRFTDPPQRPRRNNQNGAPNVGIIRKNSDDLNSTYRARVLSTNNETSLLLPDGKRLSVLFALSRSSRQLTAAEEARAVRNGQSNLGLDVEGVDFLRLPSTADGAVVELTESAVPRLKIEAPLRFGKVAVRTENQVPGFPGMYGMWLKRVGSGWHLVFNDEADVWGSQHNPKTDVAEIELTHSEGHAASRPFGVALVPTATDRGSLVIVWGPHEWTTDFVVGS